MAQSTISGRRRGFKILRLFFGLVIDFSLEYVRARLTGRTYDFFQDAANNRRRAIRIRETALQMGGVLIKIGQFLSSRVDLLPSEYIEELALLQDEVPGVPFAQIRAVVERELGGALEELFLSFDDTPVAAASLGQVHRARLRTGAVVAVKVQRPAIDAIVAVDLRSVRYIVGWLDRHTPLGRRADLPQILVEFEDTLQLELDYVSEGHHAERLAVLFRENDRIAIPRIFWSHSTGRVLTLEYMTGIKVTDFPRLDAAGISRPLVAETLMRAYLAQVLQVGFFHADPHPGNILVRPGPVIVLLDFGMVGEIPPQTRDTLRAIFLAVIRRDYDAIIVGLKRLGFFARGADMQAIKRAVIWTIENFYDLSFGELRSVDPRLVIDELQDVLFSESFRIPANYAFLGRALGTLSGLCTALDPSFQFVSVAEPYARQYLQRDHGVRATLSLAAREARALARDTYSLPFLTRDFLEDVQTGEINLRHQFVEVVNAVDRVERAMRRLLHALLVVGFLVVGSVIVNSRYHVVGIVAFVLAFVFLLRVLLPAHRRR